MAGDALRILCLCVVLAGAETLNGIARLAWLVPRIGKAGATRLSALTGTLLAFAVCWLLVPGIGLEGLVPHLWLGLGLAAFMAVFDVFVGAMLMRLPWWRIARDFDPASGNWLSCALIALMLLPGLVWWLR